MAPDVARREEFRTVTLADLRASKANTRRHRDKTADAELAASVAKVGVIEPLVVRRVDGHFEIVAGHRRAEAARTAGLDTVPAMVRELSDDEALEVQLVENLQRHDIHALDEALGYEQLQQRRSYTVEQIADRVGKSASYVYQRLKLLALTGAARKAFEADEITPGHAVMLARLQPADQAKVLAWATGSGRRETASVREVARYITDEIHLRLGAVPWDLNDAELVPKAGTCLACPKRTGAQPALWPDVKARDTCTDPACFKLKMAAAVVQKIAAFRAEHPKGALLDFRDDFVVKESGVPRAPGAIIREAVQLAGREACEHTELALVVGGERYSVDGTPKKVGDTVKICRHRTCRVHWVGASAATSPAERGRHRAQAAKTKAIATAKLAVYDAVVAKVPTGSLQPRGAQILRLVAERAFVRLWTGHQDPLFKRWGIEAKREKHAYGSGKDYDGPGLKHIRGVKSGQLLRTLAEIALIEPATQDYHGGEDAKAAGLAAAAKIVGVNAAAIERKALREATAALAARAKKAAKRAAAKKGTAKQGKGRSATSGTGHAARARARTHATAGATRKGGA